MYTLNLGKKNPIVFLDFESFQKIQAFIHLCPYEINGFGLVENIGNNIFSVSQVFILKQHSNQNGIHVEVDDEAFSDFIFQHVSQDDDETVSKMKFQWHSHVDIAVFFSGEDKNTIDKFMNDYMISLVINKRNQVICRLDVFEPVNISLEVPIFVKVPINQNLSNLYHQCSAEIESLVQIVSNSDTKINPSSTSSIPEFYFVEIQNLIPERIDIL